MPVDDPNACSMESCDGELGPDSLEFIHDGEPAGGICGQCLADAARFRVVFEKDPDGQIMPTSLVHLESMT